MVVGEHIESLRNYLSTINPGRVPDVKTLEKLLAQSWKEFEGCDGGMTASKLSRRMEAVDWAPPVLRFQIKRAPSHGARFHTS